MAQAQKAPARSSASSAGASSIPAAKDPKAGCGTPVRPSKRTRWRVGVLIGVHLVVFAHVVHWQLTGRSISPVEPSEAYETVAHGVVNAGFVLLGLTLLSTLVLGRWFCGWACHVVALQDLCASLLGRLGIRPRPVRSRLLMFVPMYAAFDLYLLPLLIRFNQELGLPTFTWQPTTEALWETFPGPGIALLTFLVDGFLVVYLLGAKGFCTYGCPYGALFGAVDRVAPARIRVTDACEGCGHCTATCTSNVQVAQEVAAYGMVVDPGCMKCTDCVSVCPKDALYFGFGKLPRAAKAAAKAHPKRRWDFSWPEEIALALVFIGALYAFRNLYGSVPFLLALGLGVIAALSALLAWRLLTRRTLSFQHHVLKREGRLTRAGFVANSLAPLFLLFTLHSAVVQVHQRAGDDLLLEVRNHPPHSPERAEIVAASLEHLRAVDRWGFVETDELHNKLGQLSIEVGDHGSAEHHLRRAIELNDDQYSARLRLAEVLIVGRRYPEATEVLGAILERSPSDDTAARRLAMIVESDPAQDEARLLLVDFLVRAGELPGARNGLAPLLERTPPDPRAVRLQERIEAGGP